MQRAMSHKFTLFFSAIVFSIILSACGGGTQNIGSANVNGDPGNTNPAPTQPPPNPDPLPTATKSVELSWLPPLSNSDGSTLNDLQGHNIYMRTGSGGFVKIYTMNTVGLTTYMVENLNPGTYTFAITAFNSDGVESTFSDTVTVTL